MEVRGVNGKGLDLRLRAPDWIEGVEPVQSRAQRRVGRGTLQVSLRVTRSDSDTVSLDETAVAGALAALARIEDMAQTMGHALALPRPLISCRCGRYGGCYTR